MQNMADAHDIQSWLNGDKLRSQKIREQYPLIGLIVALVFVYIFAGYQAAKQQHRLTDTKKEMLDAKFRYMTISAELTNSTRQSTVVEVLKENGSELRENNVAPVKIEN
jgi:cell division protein FtsL